MADKDYQTIVLEVKDEVAWIWFNRPDVHNAFNAVMLSDLDDAFERAVADDAIRVVVLRGMGKSFCAGADINWLREIVHYSFDQNLEESLHLAELLHKIYMSPKPTLAMVNGTAIGGISPNLVVGKGIAGDFDGSILPKIDNGHCSPEAMV